MLLTCPKFAARKSAAEDGGLHALCLLLYQIDDGEHTAPRLSQEMEMVNVEIIDERTEFVEPSLRSPEFGMSLHERVATAQLVVHDDGTPCLRYSIQEFEIVVGTAWSTMQEDDRALALLRLSHDTIICLIAHEGHISFLDFHCLQMF